MRTIDTFTAANGVPFRVQVTDDADTIVRFYDARYGEADGFGPVGQFVSEYYLRTLEDDTWGSVENYGLDLMGHEPEWKIDAVTMRVIMASVRRIAEAH